MISKHWVVILFSLILILAAFLRFYRLPEMANFDFDQQYASNFAYSVLKTFPLQLVGQELSVPGLYLGPIYFYYLVPFFALTGLHPLGGFIASSLWGIATVAAYFFIGRKMFGTPAGLIAAFLRAILFTELVNDWSMAPAYASELLVLFTWFIFYQYFKGQTKLLPFLGLIFGLYTSIHPILFPFYLVFLILFLIKRKLPDLKTSLLSLIAFIIPLSPLLLFEYWHSFLEVRRLLAFFTSSSGTKDLTRAGSYLQFLLSEAQRVTSLQVLPSNLFLILLLGGIFLLVTRRVGFWKEEFHKIMLPITYLVFLIYYALFPSHVPQYYFIALTTLGFLYLSATLSLFIKKRFLLVILILILANSAVVNFGKIHERWTNPSLATLYHKDNIVKEIVKRQPPGSDFYVSYIASPGWNFGFNYLFKLYGSTPQIIEAHPPVYTIILPRGLSEGSWDFLSGNIGLILSK